MSFLGLIVIIGLLISISAIIWVGILMLSFYIKKKICKMDGKKWTEYLNNMTNNGYLVRAGIMYLLAILISSILGYFIFSIFSYENPIILSVVVFILSGAKAAFKFTKNKEELLNKIKGLKNTEY